MSTKNGGIRISRSFKYFIGLITISALICHGCPKAVYAGAGDFLRAETYVKNLSSDDGDSLSLIPVYTPRHYKMDLDANGGTFASGESLMEISVVYNDGREIYDEENKNGDHKKENDSFIIIPEEPRREGYSFIGWYLRGNGMPISPGPHDGELISSGSRYMIVNDDEASMESVYYHTEGKPAALALWQKKEHFLEDGNEADKETSGEGDETGNLWDKEHVNNHVIEYVDGVEDKASYESMYGDIKDQYRRIALNAETEFAKAYTWYVRSAGTTEYKRLDHEESIYVADRLKRSNDGDVYRCEVLLGSNGESLTYETEISVHWLPGLGEPQMTAERRDFEQK